MTDDLRRFNGGRRQGAGRPPTVSGVRQVAVRLPEDMARWVAQKSATTSGGSDAEFVRRLVREAMEREGPESGDDKS